MAHKRRNVPVNARALPLAEPGPDDHQVQRVTTALSFEVVLERTRLIPLVKLCDSHALYVREHTFLSLSQLSDRLDGSYVASSDLTMRPGSPLFSARCSKKRRGCTHGAPHPQCLRRSSRPGTRRALRGRGCSEQFSPQAPAVVVLRYQASAQAYLVRSLANCSSPSVSLQHA